MQTCILPNDETTIKMTEPELQSMIAEKEHKAYESGFQIGKRHSDSSRAIKTILIGLTDLIKALESE